MKKIIRVEYNHPTTFSDRNRKITPSEAYQEYRNGTPFNVNFGATFVPPEIMSQILEFTAPRFVRKACVKAMTTGDTKKISELTQMYRYLTDAPITIENFNDPDQGGKYGIMIEQPDHPRTAYTVLEWTTTLRYQLEHWRDSWYRDHLRTEMKPSAKKDEKTKLDKTIREWTNLERELYKKATPEQKTIYEKRKKLIAEWDNTEGHHGRLPAGYFIMINYIFPFISPAYSDLVEDDEELYFLPDEDSTSLYSIPPLSDI